MEKDMWPVLLLNGTNVALITGCMIWAIRHTNPVRGLFRFFTILSNLLCAAVSLVVLLCAAAGSLPFWALLLKYAGTAAVTVTLLTVLLFLVPATRDYKRMLTGPEFFLHLLCPLLAIVSFLVFEKKTVMPAWTIAVGVLPVVLYGLVYLKKVFFTPEGRGWDDIYCFRRFRLWPVAFLLMLLGACLIAFLLWLI